MSKITDALGTLGNSWRIALGTFSASGLTSARSFTLPDKSGVISTLDDNLATMIPAGAFQTPATNGALVMTEETTGGIPFDFVKFDNLSEQFAYLLFGLPASFNTFTVRPHWKAKAGTASQTLQWKFCAAILTPGASSDVTFGTAQTLNDAYTAAEYIEDAGESPTITPSGTAAEKRLCVLKVSRPVTGTLGQPAYLFGINITRVS